MKTLPDNLGNGGGIFAHLARRWNRPAGYREVLIVAGPLILSTGSHSIQHFVDRMFLSRHSTEELAAALPAGVMSFTLISFFMGTATYANTFVAQYHGAKRHRRIGPAVWQAVYLALVAQLVFLFVAPYAETIFRWAGHTAEVARLEAIYFRILCTFAGLVVYCSALSCFFTGRGKTWTVMWVNVAGTVVNLVLDYALIFGKWGFPEMGIRGAAIATVIAGFFNAIVFTILFLLPRHQREYNTLRGWKLDGDLFRRLMRFGLPSGTQFFLDMLGFALFIFFVGRLGTHELAATNLSFQVNTLAFLPMIGFSIATSTLVGQRLGENRPNLATRATWSAFHMTFIYMTTLGALFVIFPNTFIDPFTPQFPTAGLTMEATLENFEKLRPLATTLLWFVAVYCLFDTMSLIFSAALKGAGDTRFVLWMSVGLCWPVMVLPTYLACRPGGWGVYWAWVSLSAYVILLGFGFLFRFLAGKWRSMRVIERTPET